MDPATLIGLASAFGSSAMSSANQTSNTVLNAGLSYLANKNLQEDSQKYNSYEALLTRNFNSAEAQKQRDFEERMSSTSYQRQVADMIEAGINPASIGASGGAAVPNGAVASGSNAYNSSNSVSFAPGHSAINSDLIYDAFTSALANDKSFLADFSRNLKHSAKEVSNEKKFFVPSMLDEKESDLYFKALLKESRHQELSTKERAILNRVKKLEDKFKKAGYDVSPI